MWPARWWREGCIRGGGGRVGTGGDGGGLTVLGHIQGELGDEVADAAIRRDLHFEAACERQGTRVRKYASAVRSRARVLYRGAEPESATFLEPAPARKSCPLPCLLCKICACDAPPHQYAIESMKNVHIKPRWESAHFCLRGSCDVQGHRGEVQSC